MWFSADNEFRRVRVIEKEHGACRRVGGDRRKVGSIMATLEVKEWYLF